MERRNYATILLFVFGIIGVYSYPQRSDAQEVFPSVESVQNFTNDQLSGYPVDENEKHDDGRTRRNVKQSASKKVQLLAKAMREFRVRDPRTMNSAEVAHQEHLQHFTGLVNVHVMAGIPAETAIDIVTRQQPRLADQITQFIHEHVINNH